MKVMVLFDGTIHSRIALRYGIHRAKAEMAQLFMLSVFNNEILQFYDATPRVQDMVLRDSRLQIEEAVKIIKDEGQDIKAYLIEEHGDVNKAVNKNVLNEGIDILYVPPSYRGILRVKHCPIVFIPGRFLIPLDHEEIPESNIEIIIRESAIALSDVILLGIVPVHIYSATEQEELRNVTEKTLHNLKNTSKKLSKAKVKNREILCSGYPDEEIIKVYKDLSISIIFFLEDTHRPSELNKAVNLLLDDRERCEIPIFVMESYQNNQLLRLKNCLTE